MVDTFALLLSHGLIMLALWRLLWRDDLDVTPPRKPTPDPVADSDAATDSAAPPVRPRRNQWRAPDA